MNVNKKKEMPSNLLSSLRGSRRTSRIVVGVLSIATIAVLITAAIWRVRHPEPAAPEVNLAGLDPAIADAVTEARDQVGRSPHSAQAWGKLGTVLIVHEFRPEGTFCLQQAERLDPHEPRWAYVQALDALLANDLDVAIPKLERTISLCGNDPDAPRVRLAEVYLSQNRLDQAETQFRLLLQANPRHARALFGLARISFQQGNARAALEHLALPQYDMQTRKGATVLLAQVHEQLGNSAAAEQAKQRAAILPEDPYCPDPFNEEAVNLRTGKDAWIKRGRRFSELGREDEALELLRKTVKAYPDADDAWRQLGKTLLKQKDPRYAELALRRAAELGPENFENAYYLASALVAQGKLPEATTYFRKTTELKPDYAPAWHDLGNCLFHAKDRHGAILAFRNALRYDPNLYSAHLNLALLLAEQRQFPEALAEAKLLLKLKPFDPLSRDLIVKLVAILFLPFGLI
jgi:tetratricopeptide (TPR) repeat protein